MPNISSKIHYSSLTSFNYLNLHKRRSVYLLCFIVLIIQCYLISHIKLSIKDDIFIEERKKEEALEQINKKIWESMEVEQNIKWKRFNCERIVHGDGDYIYNLGKIIINYKDNPKLSMNCSDIVGRNYFLNKSQSEEENKFPIAFARIINQDYRFLEAELATNYRPQNWYCFAVDSKSSETFYQNILSLSNCFSNIIVPKERFTVDNAGHGIGKALLSCFKELIKKERKWEYLVTLQNHDIQIKTNEEIVQIFKWLDGACDADYYLDSKLQKLNLASGNIQASLARPFVDFIVNKLDLNKMLDQLDNWEAFFIQKLLTFDQLQAPNSFTHKCIDQKINLPYVTRYNIWYFDKEKCYSKNFRRQSCIFGLNDLWHHFRTSKYLFINKMMPEYDFGAILCWHEEMRRRTLIEVGFKRLNASIYQNWPQTRYHQEWRRNSGKVDIEKFNCTYK
ncbi:hypothetical protein ACQ4LE_010019 [Meloidogyne hapla]